MAWDQIMTDIAVGGGLGFLASLLGKWSSSTPWSSSKLAYTVIISTVAAIGVIQGIQGGHVTDQNILSVIISVLGAGFLGNKAIQISSKLRTAQVTAKTGP